MTTDIQQMLESGELPKWFPDEIREDVLQHRRDLLRRHGMTLDTLREAVEEIIDVHREHFTDPNYAIYEHRSMTIRNGSPNFADRDRAILARYLYAATLGEEKGLPLVIGNDHAEQVIHGKKFPGRKLGSYAPWKKWIERKLKKDTALKPAALWEIFKAKPLRGWRAVESAKIGQYLESPTGSDDDVTYKRFQDAVGEVRRDLKKG